MKPLEGFVRRNNKIWYEGSLSSWNKNRVVGKRVEAEIAGKTIVISQAGDNAIWTRMVMVELVSCLFWMYFEDRKKIDFSDDWL